MKNKRGYRSLYTALPLALALMLVFTLPVFAYLYSAPFTIVESSGNDYTNLPVTCLADVDWLITNGFIATATALDTRVETFGGTEQLHMMADDRIMTFVPSLPAYGQLNWYFTTGNPVQDSFPIIVGYNGSATTADAVALELGDIFAIAYEGYIDTSTANMTIFEKPGSYVLNTTFSGDGLNFTIVGELSLVASSVASGDMDIVILSDGLEVWMEIDGVVEDTDTACTIPDTANNITLFASTATPYINYFGIWVVT